MTNGRNFLCVFSILSALFAVVSLWPKMADAQTLRDNLRASVTVSSDYFAHGLSQANGGPAWRVAADYQHPRGYFAGGYLANVEYPTEALWRRPREHQIAFYGGYRTGGTDWSANVMLSRYRYPGLAFSYDYTLLSTGAAYRNRFFLNIGYSPDWLGRYGSGHTASVGFAQPLGWDLELGANAGRVDIAALTTAGRYSFWDVGVSKLIDRFAIDLRYHASTADGISWLGDPGGNRWVLSLGYAITPRSR